MKIFYFLALIGAASAFKMRQHENVNEEHEGLVNCGWICQKRGGEVCALQKQKCCEKDKCILGYCKPLRFLITGPCSWS